MNYAIDQSQLTDDISIPVGNSLGTQYWESQSFTPSLTYLTGIVFKKTSNTGTLIGDIVVEIRTDDTNKPSATVLAGYTFPVTSYNAIDNGEVTAPLHCSLSAGTKYWIVIYSSNAADTGRANIRAKGTASSYAGGDRGYSTNAGSTWTIQTTVDTYFKTLYSSVKSYGGVARANIKSVNGLVRANITSVLNNSLS